MSFSGGWSLSPTAPAPSGGGWTGGTTLSPTSGSGWLGGSSSGGWLSPTSTPAPTVYSTSPTSYPAGYGYSYQSSVYALPGAGLSAGPFGDYGPYTPLDFPLLHELRPGERLTDLQGGAVSRSVLPYVVLGVIAFALLKKR